MPKRIVWRILVAAVVVASTVASALVVSDSDVPLTRAVIAALAAGAASFVAPAVSSRNRLTLAISVGAALPFVLVDGRFEAAGTMAVFFLGGTLLALTEYIRRGSVRRSLLYAGRLFVGYCGFVFAFGAMRNLVGGSLGSSGWDALVAFFVGGVIWIGIDLALWSGTASNDARVSPRFVALSGLKDLNVFITLIATGGLFGMMYGAIGWWALPVALLPYSFAHGAFRRFQETKSTYRQTIRALAQIPEVAGLNLSGHSDRTAALAVAMAQDMGLSPEEVEDVEFAALMHDIGHITLNDPTVAEHGWTREDLARWGAEIIAGAPSLDRVASHVRRQYEPYRNPGEESDPSVSKVSRIIKTASAYDAHRMGEGLSQLEALERLHQGAAYEYDPEVVASLRRVLESGVSVNA